MHIRLSLSACIALYLFKSRKYLLIAINQTLSSVKKLTWDEKRSAGAALEVTFIGRIFFFVWMLNRAMEKCVRTSHASHTYTHIYLRTHIRYITHATNRVSYTDPGCIRNAHRISHIGNKSRITYYIRPHIGWVFYTHTYSQVFPAKKPFLASTCPKRFLTKEQPRETSEFY